MRARREVTSPSELARFVEECPACVVLGKWRGSYQPEAAVQGTLRHAIIEAVVSGKAHNTADYLRLMARSRGAGERALREFAVATPAGQEVLREIDVVVADFKKLKDKYRLSVRGEPEGEFRMKVESNRGPVAVRGRYDMKFGNETVVDFKSHADMGGLGVNIQMAVALLGTRSVPVVYDMGKKEAFVEDNWKRRGMRSRLRDLLTELVSGAEALKAVNYSRHTCSGGGAQVSLGLGEEADGGWAEAVVLSMKRSAGEMRDLSSWRKFWPD